MKRLLVILLLCVVGIPFAASAEPTAIRARGINHRGMLKYNLGEYGEALELFKKAYELNPEANVLFNLGQCYRKLNQYELALDAYKKYLHEAPRATNRDVVEELIVALEKAIETKEKPPIGPEETPEPPPAPHVIQQPAEPPPPLALTQHEDVTEPRRWYRDPLGWTLVGGGLLAVGAGTVFFVHARGQKGDLSGVTENERAPLRDDIKRNQTLGGVGFGLGGALLATGIIRLVLVERNATRGSDVAVAVGADGVFVAGRF